MSQSDKAAHRLQRKHDYDVVTGTRYLPGGGVYGWDLRRKLVSKGANMLAKLMLWPKASDVTGSFRSALNLYLLTMMLKDQQIIQNQCLEIFDWTNCLSSLCLSNGNHCSSGSSRLQYWRSTDHIRRSDLWGEQIGWRWDCLLCTRSTELNEIDMINNTTERFPFEGQTISFASAGPIHWFVLLPRPHYPQLVGHQAKRQDSLENYLARIKVLKERAHPWESSGHE